MSTQYTWWQKGIIYQIYPRSYQDSNGDGVGDLNGIIRRLDYIKSLNVNAIWLSPIYPSPMYDFGYDVADYCDIHPVFGTMEDFDNLLAEAHKRGLRLILDLVPNHTSDQHPWFQESRSSRNNTKRDWYIWRDPGPKGTEPNNWLSHFGGPAWSYDPLTGQYYMHQFDKHQPELNYRNSEVLAAIRGVMRFWLDKGIDGFRVDVLYRLLKDAQFRDEPPDPGWNGIGSDYLRLRHIYTGNLPEVHEVIRSMRAVIDEYDDRLMIGEVYLPIDELIKYYGENLDEAHLPYNFLLLSIDWSAKAIQKVVNEYDSKLPEGAWPNWVLGNHDKPRIATRVGSEQARVANMLLLTLRGTPTTYYGEEIGMKNVPIPMEMIQDPPAIHQPKIANIVGRDPVRTPMQWCASKNAGFSPNGVKPWLPVSADYEKHNVAIQEVDQTSMLNLYKTLTKLRLSEPSLSVGSYFPIETGREYVFAYLREEEGFDEFLVVLNFGADTHHLNFGRIASGAVIEISTDMVRQAETDLSNLVLNSNEGLVLRLRNQSKGSADLE